MSYLLSPFPFSWYKCCQFYLFLHSSSISDWNYIFHSVSILVLLNFLVGNKFLGWPACGKEPSFQTQYHLNQSLVLLWKPNSWCTPWTVINVCDRNIGLVYHQSFSFVTAWSSRGESCLPSITFLGPFQHL